MHQHIDHHKDLSDSSDLKKIGIAFVLNLIFAIIEIVGGLWTNSVAILADATHDLGDSIALGIAWFFQKLSKKGSNYKYSYGYKRFSVLGALINSMILLVGSTFILIETIPRLIEPEESHSVGMIILAVVGIAANGAAFSVLRKGDSINIKVVSLHLLEDVLGWVAVLIGATIMYFTGWKIIDPILSILISSYILINVYKNIKKVVKIIMQGTPSDDDLVKVSEYLDGLPELVSYHDLHYWTLDGQYNIMSVHLVVPDEFAKAEITALKEKVKSDLKELKIEHPTIEIEFEAEKCDLRDNGSLQ